MRGGRKIGKHGDGDGGGISKILQQVGHRCVEGRCPVPDHSTMHGCMGAGGALGIGQLVNPFIVVFTCVLHLVLLDLCLCECNGGGTHSAMGMMDADGVHHCHIFVDIGASAGVFIRRVQRRRRGRAARWDKDRCGWTRHVVERSERWTDKSSRGVFSFVEERKRRW